MKMQDFMQKIKEKKLKRSDWLILVLAGILQRKIIPWRHLRMK